MNLEKLGFLLFLKATQEHQKVAAPIKKALTQLVLAGLNSAKLVQSATLESEVLKPYGSAHKTLKQFDALNNELLQWLGRAEKTPDASKNTILRQIVTELLEGLEIEKKGLENSDDPTKAAQIQVLASVGEALQNRFMTDDAASPRGDRASKRTAS